MVECACVGRSRSFCAKCPDLMSAVCPEIGSDCGECEVDCLCKVEHTPQRIVAYAKWFMESRRVVHNKGKKLTDFERLRQLGKKCNVCGCIVTDRNKSGRCRAHVGTIIRRGV